MPSIPAVPNIAITQGADPKLWIPQSLSGTPGSTVTVPVMFLRTNPTAVAPDAADEASGEVLISVRSAAGSSITLEPGFEGTLFLADLWRIRPGASPVAARINLLADARAGGRVFSTSLDDGNLTLVPAPTDSDLDPVDGMVTIDPTVLLRATLPKTIVSVPAAPGDHTMDTLVHTRLLGQ